MNVYSGELTVAREAASERCVKRCTAGHDHSPTLWVGTNAGTVYIHQLTVPVTDKRSTDEVQCVLCESGFSAYS